MRTVHKAILEPRDVPDRQYVRAEITVPHGSQFLSTHVQNDQIAVWYECDSESESENVEIIIVPTGGDVPEFGFRFLGTAFVSWTVWHIYIPLPPF